MLIRESYSLPVAPHTSMLKSWFVHWSCFHCLTCLFPSQSADINILIYNAAANAAVDTWFSKCFFSWYQESGHVVQEAAKATTEASFQERGVLWRDVLRQQARRSFTAGLPICRETRISNLYFRCVFHQISQSAIHKKNVLYCHISWVEDIKLTGQKRLRS